MRARVAQRAAAAIYLLSFSILGVGKNCMCIISVHYVYGFCQLYRHFSPLICAPLFSVCARWGISCGAKGATKRFYITTLLSARGIKSKMHTHIHIHTRQKAIQRGDRESDSVDDIYYNAVCVCRRGIFAARMQHNKKHLPPTV
jgi:hypothetical protein